LGYGHFAWVFFYGALGNFFGARGVFPVNAPTNLSALINHSLYGMTTAAVIAKLGDPALFPEPGDRGKRQLNEEGKAGSS